MQERQRIDEIIKEWNGVYPETVGEAHSQGVEKGRIEGEEKGREKGSREATYEIVERLIQDGVPDSDIQRYTQLSLAEIEQLKNGNGIS